MDTKVYYGSAYNLEGVYDFDEYFQMIFLLEEGGEWLPCKVDMGRRRVLYVRKNVKLIIAKNNVKPRSQAAHGTRGQYTGANPTHSPSL